MSEASIDTGTDGRTETERAIEAYETAIERRKRAETRVAEFGEEKLKALSAAHERATTLLDRYEGPASGTGDFEAFIEFGERFSDLVGGLPEDLPERGAFERADDRLEKRRLSERDFEAARTDLEAAAELAGRLGDRETAREREHETKRVLENRRDELDARISDLRELRRLAEADLDAPVEELHEPIVVYNRTMRESFGTFRDEASARAVMAFLETTRVYPLVELERPPEELRRHLEDEPIGGKSLPTVREYAGYSLSKLEHYVEKPRALKASVATNRSYLSRLDASAMRIEWPPPPADELRFRCRELVSVVARFASGEVLEALRKVRALTRRERYGRLREAAISREAIDDEQRARLENGAIEAELEAVREERDRIAEARAELGG